MSAPMSKESCACGSGRGYARCCGPFLSGEALPETAEELMRSRYVAYTRQDIDYLESTSSAAVRKTFKRRQAKKWARSATFTGLDVQATELGGPEDMAGIVEFEASFQERGKPHILHERSAFGREDGAWRYTGGTKSPAVRRTGTKVGRNDPCPCGSGKKYKKCCGR